MLESKIIEIIELVLGKLPSETKEILVDKFKKDLPLSSKKIYPYDIKPGDYFVWENEKGNGKIDFIFGLCDVSPRKTALGIFCSKYLDIKGECCIHHHVCAGQNGKKYRLMTKDEIRWFNSRFENND